MEIAGIGPINLEFPGAAGDYQRRGLTTALIRELGDNYATYHEFLRSEFGKFPGRPSPNDFVDLEEYFDAWARMEAIAKGEALMRRCRAFRLSGRRLDAWDESGRPLIDRNDRLVSVE